MQRAPTERKLPTNYGIPFLFNILVGIRPCDHQNRIRLEHDAEWWVWMSGALILATLEVLIPGYIFLGFAIGAGVMGLLILLGVSATGLALTLVIFAILSLISYLAMRKYFGLKTGQVKIWDTDVND